ncbi:unnamed protein product [Adineta ricciae]|uniref:Uncharacterized protein n=1 Tax=Adineta ricciae TaxID=249248 RepID=A0A815RX63_ADIRI|nr:unnamed protein product [Adineta ricciae]
MIRTSLKSTSDQPTVFYQREQRNQSRCQCSISRFVRIQLLLLLALLVLAAIIIPIVVLVYDNRNSTPPCSITYTGTFISGVTPTTQCDDWRAFTTIGISVTDTSVITPLAIALRYNTTILTSSNGVSWRAGSCGSGFELAANGACTCSSNYALRPCQGSSSWGGIASSSCGAQTQTISLHLE